MCNVLIQASRILKKKARETREGFKRLLVDDILAESSGDEVRKIA